MLSTHDHPVLLLLHQRERFWERIQTSRTLYADIGRLIPFIILVSAVYGAILAGWRSPRLSVYVSIKFPLLLLGTTSIVAMFNWILSTAFRSGLTLQQVLAVTFGAITVSCWILSGLLPITFFFTNFVSSCDGSHAEIQLKHNYLLLIHITLIAFAGIAGNTALRRGLLQIVSPGCAIHKLYWSWLAMFAFVGCQLSWILRPFVGSPFYPIVFMRPDCLHRNFYEFVFSEVIPYVIKGGNL